MTDRPTWRDAAALGFASSLGPFAVNAYVPGFFHERNGAPARGAPCIENMH